MNNTRNLPGRQTRSRAGTNDGRDEWLGWSASDPRAAAIVRQQFKKLEIT